MTEIVRACVALFTCVAVTWSLRDCWKRWLAHRDRAREVDAGLLAARKHFDEQLTAALEHLEQQLSELEAKRADEKRESDEALAAARKALEQGYARLEKQNQALVDEMVAAKRIVDDLQQKATARELGRPRQQIVGHR